MPVLWDEIEGHKETDHRPCVPTVQGWWMAVDKSDDRVCELQQQEGKHDAQRMRHVPKEQTGQTMLQADNSANDCRGRVR